MSKTIRPTSAGVFPELEDGIHNLSLGNGTQHEVMVYTKGPRGLFVGIVGKKCYTFTTSHHWGYIGEKLGICEGDAMNMADFVSSQMGGSYTKQGEYHPNLCSDKEVVA